MKKRIKTISPISGKWIETNSNDYLTCCDCGLVHRVEFKVKINTETRKVEKFYTRFWRNDKMTKQMKKNPGRKTLTLNK